MTRSLAVSTFLIGALSLAIGANDAEARHCRRHRCCNTGFVNYGYQNANYGYQNSGACCNGGMGSGPTYNNQGTYQNQNNGNQAAPPPPTESAPPPAPKT
jgi:hypothetical protein